MEEKSNYKRKGIMYLLLSILWMAVIFMFSAQTGDVSGRQSGFLADIIKKVLPFELTDEGYENLTFIIRKAAHFTEYGVLGALYFKTAYWIRAAWQEKNLENEKCMLQEKNAEQKIIMQQKNSMSQKNSNMKSGKKTAALCKTVFLTTILCMLYATSDEFHQSFTDGRSPAVRDVIIDTCGGFTGGMLMLWVTDAAAKRKRRVEQRRNEDKNDS